MQEDKYQEIPEKMNAIELREKITQLVKERRSIIEHVLVPEERTEALRAINTDIAEYASLRADLETIDVQYENIDSWNRPIFREVGGSRRYGCGHILFPYQESESEVLKKVESKDLDYFGRHFDCEPEGTSCTVTIVESK